MGESWGKGTICVQGGYTPKNGEPRVFTTLSKHNV